MTQAFDERLRLYMKVLVADVAALTDGTAIEVGNMGEPQFQIPLSGWYWQIVRIDAEKSSTAILRTSRSLFSETLPHLIEPTATDRPGDQVEGFITGPDNKELRVLEQLIDFGESGRFYVSVAGGASEITEETRRFMLTLAGTFCLLLAALIGSTLIQVRFGLGPLRRLRQAVSDIREGKAETIGETFPEEVAPLALELNQMIDANREIVDRARMQVGNLAHALKTPISVLVNESEGDDSALAGKLREQTGVMKDQVQYYLDRARAAARAASIGSVTEVDPVIAGFLRTFPKIYRDRHIDFTATGDPGLRFRGERQDFEDMIGNLIDNAGKWAHSTVEICVLQEPANGDGPARMRIVIDDDGPGLSPEGRKQATRRGRRLDETKPGSGLGLSIVSDLAGLYHGAFTLDQSPLGGLRAMVILPTI